MIYRHLFSKVMDNSRQLDEEYEYLVEYDDITRVTNCTLYDRAHSFSSVSNEAVSTVFSQFWLRYKVATSGTNYFMKLGFTSEFDILFHYGELTRCRIWICSNNYALNNSRMGFLISVGKSKYLEYRNAYHLCAGDDCFGYFVLKDDNLLRFILNNVCENLGNELVRY